MSSRISKFQSVVVSLGLALGLFAGLAHAEAVAPDTFVKNFSNEVLTEIKANKKDLIANPSKLEALVDKKVMPNVDFFRMTGLVVGLPWRSATPDQRNEVAKQFRELLVKTYSGALSQVGDQTVVVDKPRMRPDDTEVIVTSKVMQTNGAPPIDLAYRVEKKADKWQIYDFSVLGLWLVDSYKQQFKPVLDNGGVDALIAALKAKNSQ